MCNLIDFNIFNRIKEEGDKTMEQQAIISLEISEFQIYLFHEGTNYKAYDFLGAIYFPGGDGHAPGFRFAVWAPNAINVSLVGDFNGWEVDKDPMKDIKNSGGIWSVFIPDMKPGELYKYAITSPTGEVILKADPYGYCSEFRPDTASVTYRLDEYKWRNSINKSPDKVTTFESPMLIYEVHLGSWKRHEDGSFLTYRELSEELIPYVVNMGYTHIELMPIQEYPYDASWGYQVVGYYSCTRRYGDPEDLMYFIDRCHDVGLKVIMDWVPAHFPKDSHGLAKFDGTCLYEYEDKKLGEHPHWGTLVFDYRKPQVQSFLISNAMFWLEEYRVDGFRVDAVSSMIYLNYGREEGEWEANKYGGNGNLEAMDFLKNLNKAIFAEFPNVLMIAEESTAFPKVTAPVHEEGLGFNYKWNMGWMHDSLNYFATDPLFRKGNHNLLTFVMMYAYSENYILPLSHDEVVHGKKSLIDKMYGSYEEKFDTLRAFYAYAMALPGKKLLFMGGEFGQFTEWNFEKGLDWNLLEYESHKRLHNYVRELNNVYKSNKSMYQLDTKGEGFEWIEADDAEKSVLVFMRKGKQNGEYIIVVSNFTPVARKQYSINVPTKGQYYEVINSNWIDYGGDEDGPLVYTSSKEMNEGKDQHLISMDLAPLSTVYLREKGETRR